MILGRHLGFLKPDSSSELAARLAEAVRIHFTASRDAFYGLPLWKLLPTSAYKQLIESEDEIYKYVLAGSWRYRANRLKIRWALYRLLVFSIISEIVEATILEKRNDARDESVEAVFQSILKQKSLDICDKKAAIVDFIAAGIHTVRTLFFFFTASRCSSSLQYLLIFACLPSHGCAQLGNTLVFLFYLIGRNPDVQAKLYEETYSLAPPGCDLTIEDLRHAKYLRACITESFRCVTRDAFLF